MAPVCVVALTLAPPNMLPPVMFPEAEINPPVKMLPPVILPAALAVPPVAKFPPVRFAELVTATALTIPKEIKLPVVILPVTLKLGSTPMAVATTPVSAEPLPIK